ncbi:hypothetical protein BHM03_00010887 [Ensete ventricosum]|nr:hypothetical protein BHM03_00010887 [Ensete ventricosum]
MDDDAGITSSEHLTLRTCTAMPHVPSPTITEGTFDYQYPVLSFEVKKKKRGLCRVFVDRTAIMIGGGLLKIHPSELKLPCTRELIRPSRGSRNLGDLAERANSGTNLGDLAERANSGINLGDLTERANSGTNLGDLAERVNLGTNLGYLVEKMNLGTNLGELAERANSGTNLGDLIERVNSGTNLGDLAERVNSGTNLGDLAERMNSCTNLDDLAEKVNSGTNLGDLAERANSGTNLGNLTEKVNSGTNLGDLAEKVNSGTNLRDLAERANSGTNLGDLAEKVNPGTNLGDLAKRVNLGTNLGDLAEKVNLGTNLGDLAERANSGTNLGDLAERANPGTNLGGEPEASSSGASSGPSSPVDARVLRDLEVMKAGHNLDTAVTKGSLTAIRERYSIPTEYRLYVPQPGQCPYSSDVPGVCISVDALEAGLRFPLHPIIEECIRWWRISPSQVAPNSWRYLVVFLGECRGVGIILTRNVFMACFRLCKSRGGYYLIARVSFRVSGAPSNNKGWKSRCLFVSGLNWGFRLDWSAYPIGNVPRIYPRRSPSWSAD